MSADHLSLEGIAKLFVVDHILDQTEIYMRENTNLLGGMFAVAIPALVHHFSIEVFIVPIEKEVESMNDTLYKFGQRVVSEGWLPMLVCLAGKANLTNPKDDSEEEVIMLVAANAVGQLKARALPIEKVDDKVNLGAAMEMAWLQGEPLIHFYKGAQDENRVNLTLEQEPPDRIM